MNNGEISSYELFVLVSSEKKWGRHKNLLRWFCKESGFYNRPTQYNNQERGFSEAEDLIYGGKTCVTIWHEEVFAMKQDDSPYY